MLCQVAIVNAVFPHILDLQLTVTVYYSYRGLQDPEAHVYMELSRRPPSDFQSIWLFDQADLD